MYYYKTFYEDGTYDYLKSKKAIHDSKRVCNTCTRIKLISIVNYYFHQFTKLFSEYFYKNP